MDPLCAFGRGNLSWVPCLQNGDKRTVGIGWQKACLVSGTEETRGRNSWTPGMCVSSDLPVPPRRHERHVSEGCKSRERVGRLPRCDGEVHHLDSKQSLFFARLKFRCRAPLLVISFIAPGSGDPRRVPFMSSHVQIKNLPLRAAPARGFRRRPRRWLHRPLHRPRRPLRASVSLCRGRPATESRRGPAQHWLMRL